MTGAPSSTARFWPIVARGKCLGHLMTRGVHGVECFDRDDRSLGIFATAEAALAALSAETAP
jgi:hypothetical protein